MNLTSVEYNIKETNQIIFENVLKMFKRRNLIENVNDVIENNTENIMSNKIIKIKISNGSNALLYIINDKVTSITQNSPIDEFLSSNTNLLKIVVIKDPSKKTFKQIMENYPNSEGFFQNEFMEDIPAKDIIPKHSLINSDEEYTGFIIYKQKTTLLAFIT